MVKLILPNSAPPGQESQKCLENSATDLVTPRKTRAFVTSRQSKNLGVGHLAHGEKNFSLCARWPKSKFFCALIFETFLALLARRSRVGQNEFHHWIRLWKLQILSPTCIFTTGSLWYRFVRRELSRIKYTLYHSSVGRLILLDHLPRGWRQ